MRSTYVLRTMAGRSSSRRICDLEARRRREPTPHISQAVRSLVSAHMREHGIRDPPCGVDYDDLVAWSEKRARPASSPTRPKLKGQSDSRKGTWL